MATLLFANFAATTLAGPLSTTQTTCNVAAGSGTSFPQPGNGQYFKLVFLDAVTRTVREIVNVTGVSGDTFTIVRAQEGTAAATWNAGDIAGNLITAGSFATFAQIGNLPTSFVSGTDTGSSANTVVAATTTPAVSAPSAGQIFLITKSSSGNTGATTFQIASGTAYSVVYKDGTALGPGSWPAGAAAFLYFTGGVMQFVACEPPPVVRFHSAPVDTGTADAIVLAPSPPVVALGENTALLFVKGAAANVTATPTIAVSNLPATVVTRFDGSALSAGDLPAGAEIPVKYLPSTAQFRLLWPIAPTQVRRKLSGNLNLYVLATGNDGNSGLTNTAGGAFATLQGCWNAIFGLYDPAGFTITINLGIGAGGAFSNVNFFGYTGAVVLNGDPSNVATINCGAATNPTSPITIPAGGNITIQNLRLDYNFTGTEPPVEGTINNSGNLVVGANVTFNCSNNRADLDEIVSVGSGASVVFSDGITVTVTGAGSRVSFINSSAGSSVRVAISGGLVQFVSSGTITYNTFAVATLGSTQNWTQGRFGGFTGTGNRAFADGNAVIQLGGQTLPGNATAATPTHGGQVY